MPAIPMAGSSPPMVVGMRHTSKATSTVMETAVPCPLTSDAVDREGQEGRHDHQEHDGEGGEQDGEGDLVRGLLALGALDQTDHPVEEAFAGVGRHPHHEPVGQHARARR